MKNSKLIIPLILIATIIFISGCTQSTDTGTTKQVKAQKKLTIISYCKSTGEPPPCPENDTIITQTQEPTPTETLPPTLPTSQPTATTQPPTLPTSTATPTTASSSPVLVGLNTTPTPTSDCTVTYTPPKEQWQYGACIKQSNGKYQKAITTKYTYTYQGSCDTSTLAPNYVDCTPDPTLSPTPTATTTSSPTPTSTISSTPSPSTNQYGCCLVCQTSQTGHTFFVTSSVTLTQAECNQINQNWQGDPYGWYGDVFWSSDPQICPTSGNSVYNIDVYKFCAAFGRVPP